MVERACEIDECARPHYAKGKCQMHYARLLRGKEVGPAHPIDRVGMSIDRTEYSGDETTCPCGAMFRQRAIGMPKKYCSTRCRDKYYQRDRRAAGYVRPPQPSCTVDGCEKEQSARGWCVMHLERVNKYGTPGEAVSRRAAKGAAEWKLNREGYLCRSFNGEAQLQHRFVME